MKAGLTGYAQIEGRYNTSPEDKLALDLFYIEGFSLDGHEAASADSDGLFPP